MPSTEELRILLQTVADTSGATKTQQALQGVQRQAAQTGATTSGSMNASAASMTRLGVAIGGTAGALALAHQAAARLVQVVTDSADAFVNAERVTRAASAAYGAMASDWVRFAEGMSAATGFSRDSILEAALSARTLSTNYGLATDQTKRLIQVSGDLARIRGIGVEAAFERVQSAIRGEAEASEYLGLTLNDTFLKEAAYGGGLRSTWEQLDKNAKAQATYAEFLKQTADFSGLAADAADSLGGAQLRANNATLEFHKTLGAQLAPALKDATNLYTDLTGWATRFVGSFGTAQSQVGNSLATIIAAVAETQRQIIAGEEGPTVVDPVIGDAKTLDDILGTVVTTTKQTKAELDKLAQSPFQRMLDDLGELDRRLGDLGKVRDLLPTTDLGTRAALSAEQDLQRIDQVLTARQAAAARQAELRRFAEIRGQVSDPRDAPGVRAALAQIALYDQLEAAQRELINLQLYERDLGQERAQLATQEARAVLDMLPARQEIARLEREINVAGNERLRIQQEMRLNAAQLQATPSQFGLEDTQRALERARLVAADRSQPPEARAQARREIRGTERNVLPRQQLEAFDAQTAVLAAERQQRLTGLQTRAAQLPLEDRRAALTSAIAPQEEALLAIRDSIERQESLSNIAAAAITSQQQVLAQIIEGAIERATAAATGQVSPVALTVNITHADGRTDTYQELIEANAQAQTPPVVQVSGVRRN